MKFKQYALKISITFLLLFSFNLFGQGAILESEEMTSEQKRVQEVEVKIRKIEDEYSKSYIQFDKIFYQIYPLGNVLTPTRAKLDKKTQDIEEVLYEIKRQGLKEKCKQINTLYNSIGKTLDYCSTIDGRIRRLNERHQEVRNEIANLQNKDKAKSNEEKVSLGFGNTGISSSNSNNSYSATDSNNRSENSQSNTTAVSSKSNAELHYQNALKNQQLKNDALETKANTIVNTAAVAGSLIVNAIDKKRLDNIRIKNDFISRELPNINKVNNDLNVLFQNKNYEAFNEIDKKLRNVETTVLENLEWIFQHNGGANFELERQIIKNQRNRSRLTLKINTESLIKESKKLKNKALLMRCHDLYISEIKELAGSVTNDKGQFLEGSDFKLYEYWVNFIDEERKERVRILLNLNTNYTYFNRNWETYFYLSNNYHDTKFDEKAKEAFLKSGVKDRIAFLTWILTSWNYIDYSNKDDSHLRMILGDGSELIYYYDVGTALSKGKPIPLYKYLNNSYNGYKKTKSNELVKSWVKKDELKEGKKSSDFFDDHLKETTGVSSKEKKIVKASMLKVEKLMKKKSYDKALIEIKKIREIEPNNFKYIIGEANIYFKKEDFKNYIRLLKEAVKIKPFEVDLFYRIGYLEMNSRNYNEAVKITPSKKVALDCP